MALAKKWGAIQSLDSDIYSVQECSQEQISLIGLNGNFQTYWLGANKNKGLGVIVRKPFKILKATRTKQEWIAKLKIGGPEKFELYPVWACIPRSGADDRYIRQIHLFLDTFKKKHFGSKAILIGDFNSNSIWDNEHRTRSHGMAVVRLKQKGMQSAYHQFFEKVPGKESHPTIYFRKNLKLTYHIDYCFLSEQLLARIKKVEVGQAKSWLKFSDHMPLTVSI